MMVTYFSKYHLEALHRLKSSIERNIKDPGNYRNFRVMGVMTIASTSSVPVEELIFSILGRSLNSNTNN